MRKEKIKLLFHVFLRDKSKTMKKSIIDILESIDGGNFRCLS